MAYLLNVVYSLLLILFLPRLIYGALVAGKYRQGFAAKFLGRVQSRTDSQPCVWIHAVSLGEVNLIASLVEKLDREWDGWQCVISTTTKTGYELALKRYPRHQVIYCPLDFSWAVKSALRRIRPDLLILAELELWPNLIRYASKAGTKVAVINGRLSENSFRGYRRIRLLVRPIMRRLDLIAAQNEVYAERFRQLGAATAAVQMTGSLKFDGAETQRDNPATLRLRRLAGITPQDTVLLAGSTQAPEELLTLATYRQLVERHPELRLVLVPRHPERFDEVAAILNRSGLPWQRRSELKSNVPASSEARILLVDVIGELGAWWGTAQIGFVGGSLTTRGGQNMIEPAAYGAAVCFGPNTWNFRDIVLAMLDADAAHVVHDEAQLYRFVERCLEDPTFAAQLGTRASELVKSQLGATDRTLRLLGALIDRHGESTQQSRAA